MLPGAGTAGADHSTFAPGDLLVGVGSSKVQWRHPDGTLNQTLTTAVSSPHTTGMAFGPNGTSCAGKLYVTGFTSNAVSRFNNDGTPDGVYASFFNSHPESIVFGFEGTSYMGQQSGSRDILRSDCAATSPTAFNALPDGRKGTDRIDLAPDQCTIYYTSEGKRVKRFDTCTNTQLSDFASNLPGTAAKEVRILLDGTVLVADTQAIHRLDASGSIIQSYDAPGIDCWTALALADAGSFWAGCGASVHKFDLSSGTELLSFGTGSRTSVQGLAVFRGPTAATSADLSMATSDTPDPVSSSTSNSTSFVLHQPTVTNGGPAPTAGVTLGVGLSGGGSIVSASGAGWVCALGSVTTADCTLGPPPGTTVLMPGASATVDVLVQVPTAAEGGMLQTAATASGFGPDHDPADNTAVEVTTIGPAVRNNRVTFCPEGGCVADTDITGEGPDKTDNTVTRVAVPAADVSGGLLTIDESAGGIECGGGNNESQQSHFALPPGYDDPDDPISLTLTLHSSSGVKGQDTILCVLKEGEEEVVVVPPCLIPGVADPSPCVDQVTSQGKVTQVTSLWLSVDPFVKGG
jgi:hypothetical protein